MKVRGCYEGRGLPLARMIEKLRSVHSQSLPEFIVRTVNALPKRPLLLAVQMLSSGSPFSLAAGAAKDGGEDVVLIICAANYDLQVLGVCDLVGGGKQCNTYRNIVSLAIQPTLALTFRSPNPLPQAAGSRGQGAA